MNRIVIAIDGPAGAGKSTISKLLAKRLAIEYIDTGAMYRAITLKTVHKNIDIQNKLALSEMLANTEVNFIEGKIILDNTDVSKEIRLPEISQKVSAVSSIKEVREKLVELQRNMAEMKSVIMDGRDIGTNVLKNADLKVFLTASVEERGKRRYNELIENGFKASLEEVCKEVADRDNKDSTREINPLTKAEDAIELDTTSKTIDNVVNEIIKLIDRCKE